MILNVSCNDEYYDEYPTRAEIKITKELCERIIELQKVLKRVKAIKICEWASPDKWLDEDGEEWDGRVDCGQLAVWEGHVRWSDYIKNTSIEIETGEISLQEIFEIHKVYQTPQKDLPLLIADLKSEEAKDILQKRLKNENEYHRTVKECFCMDKNFFRSVSIKLRHS